MSDSRKPTAISAIETSYGGCKFRSRLEARWAMFFDRAGIQWEYEPEGFEVGPGHDRRRYLPDFYLPRVDRWVEVKGRITVPDQLAMFHAAHPEHGLPGVASGLLMLGEVPRVAAGDMALQHQIVHMDDEWDGPGIYTRGVMFMGRDELVDWGAPGLRISDPAEPNPSGWAFQSYVSEAVFAKWECPAEIREAYAFARAARFEFGDAITDARPGR